MGSRQFDFHNGCVASQAAASEREPRERTQRTDADGVVVFLLFLLRSATYFVRISL